MIAGEATRIVPGTKLDRRLVLIELNFSKSELSNLFTLTHLQNQKKIGGKSTYSQLKAISWISSQTLCQIALDLKHADSNPIQNYPK